MKTRCPSCTFHFADKFSETLKPDCEFWVARGLSKLPKKYKKRLWQWMFSFDFDEMYLKTGYAISVGLSGEKRQGHKFADIKEYRQMSEKQRREFQIIYAKAKELDL